MSTDPMSTDSMYRCSQCKQFKPSDEYGTRQRGSNHGQKGDRLFCCRSCSASKSAKRKRERVEGNADRPEKRLATEPPISPSQFVEALAKHASASEIDDSWCISLDEITLTDKGIADHIASLAWKATGYRFTFHTSRTTTDGLRKTFLYECCQARGTSNDREKRPTVGEKDQRIARRMERFDCHGGLRVKLQNGNGNGIALVKMAHKQSHKAYVCIDLPEKWRTFIKDNHSMGPAKLWQEILYQSKGDGILFTQKAVRYAWTGVASERSGHECEVPDPEQA